ncbi:VWA domain-containing protein [uncultured Pelagimonas sp.]|uniref:nitric oxide reductase activation protein NorD n=1 Tax=uncultured Pelagimonas sp. TaxID=1618102 RepID=UPI00262770E1|nr:VWA domain-containing protein [uncultured Pelagimonas sp.]
MTSIDIEPWEPEETVGKLWHNYASRLDAPVVHDGARVDLSEVGGRLAVLFRGLGGDPSVELKPVGDEVSHHRLTLRRKLGTWAEAVPRASYDGMALRMPESLAVFPAREANAALYLWLAAAAAGAAQVDIPVEEDDPLRADMAGLRAVQDTITKALEIAPGFAKLYRDLCEATLFLRRTPTLPPAEAAIEAIIARLLGSNEALSERATAMLASINAGDYGDWHAPRGYLSFRPVALWPDLRPSDRSESMTVANPETEGETEQGDTEEGRARKARRRKADAIDRPDSFILHKFEAILSWAEFMNINRRVEDDENDDAKKAADDQEEIGLGQIKQAPATRLKLHLDLAPEDVDREMLSAVTTYPEWDCRTGTYMRNHCRVLASPAEAGDVDVFTHDPRAQARIRAVRRQFEALRPGRVSTHGHPDGDELNTERAVRAHVDFLATGVSDDRVWNQTRAEKRDLAVSILLDVSRSTESSIPGHGHDGRRVIDVEREALAAFAWGLDACGDDFAINAFSSLKRDRVYVQNAKSFEEQMTKQVEGRIGALQPGFYTRLGAAMRHVSKDLSNQPRKRRLLLVITDGKPNDLDHYEGRHGIEDSRMAVQEARRAGHAVYGIAVDRDGKSWFPRIFGKGGYALIPEPDKLIQALPRIYRELVGAG